MECVRSFHVCAGRAGCAVIQKFHNFKIAKTWTSLPDIRQSLTSIANSNREIAVHRLPPPRWTVSLSWRTSFGGIAIATRGLNCLARCISVQRFAPCVETTPRMPIISSSVALMAHPELFVNSGESCSPICKQLWRKNSVLENAVQRDRNFFFLGSYTCKRSGS